MSKKRKASPSPSRDAEEQSPKRQKAAEDEEVTEALSRTASAIDVEALTQALFNRRADSAGLRLQHYNVKELKEKAKDNDVETSGGKAAIVEKLVASMKEKGEQKAKKLKEVLKGDAGEGGGGGEDRKREYFEEDEDSEDSDPIAPVLLGKGGKGFGCKKGNVKPRTVADLQRRDTVRVEPKKAKSKSKAKSKADAPAKGKKKAAPAKKKPRKAPADDDDDDDD